MRLVSAAIAVVVGLLVLAGYFVSFLAGVQDTLMNWAMILAGAATLFGVFNLILVHGERIHRRETGNVYSIVFMLALFISLTLNGGVLALRFYQLPVFPVDQLLVDGIIAPTEAALLAILTVTLLYTAMRLLRRRADLMSGIFLATAVLVLMGSMTLPTGDIPVLGNMLHPWISQVWALGGARGILIGVALGTLMTGLRVLFAVDRPYGGK